MEWFLGIITGLLGAILLVLTGNTWVCPWILVGAIVWFVWVVVKGVLEEERERQAKSATKRAAN